MEKFRYRKKDKPYIQGAIDLIGTERLEAVPEENWDELITSEEAVLVCGPWSPLLGPFHGAMPLRRLCSRCGAEIACHPDNVKATQIICMPCMAKGNYEF